MYLERAHPAFLTTLVVLVFLNPTLRKGFGFENTKIKKGLKNVLHSSGSIEMLFMLMYRVTF